eukprot:TRINITY_DN463_c0_g1_i1.p1 TRINITY_DN463_c0_g1~~TRINITY_DN463_c0_g1_i1.p1  ORF type:complete len:162 (-),score=29.09 TRINITY_DN463_c0_g1_i1:391-876(-)
MLRWGLIFRMSNRKAQPSQQSQRSAASSASPQNKEKTSIVVPSAISAVTSKNRKDAAAGTATGSIRIIIQAKPGAKQNGITHIDNENVGIQIAAPPREGAANEELIEYLSDVLGIKKRSIQFEAGSTSRSKVLIVSPDSPSITPESLYLTLKKHMTGSDIE